jgi:hypothetical protein
MRPTVGARGIAVRHGHCLAHVRTSDEAAQLMITLAKSGAQEAASEPRVSAGAVSNALLGRLCRHFPLEGAAAKNFSTALRVAAVRQSLSSVVVRGEPLLKWLGWIAQAADALRHLTPELMADAADALAAVLELEPLADEALSAPQAVTKQHGVPLTGRLPLGSPTASVATSSAGRSSGEWEEHLKDKFLQLEARLSAAEQLLQGRYSKHGDEQGNEGEATGEAKPALPSFGDNEQQYKEQGEPGCVSSSLSSYANEGSQFLKEMGHVQGKAITSGQVQQLASELTSMTAVADGMSSEIQELKQQLRQAQDELNLTCSKCDFLECKLALLHEDEAAQEAYAGVGNIDTQVENEEEIEQENLDACSSEGLSEQSSQPRSESEGGGSGTSSERDAGAAAPGVSAKESSTPVEQPAATASSPSRLEQLRRQYAELQLQVEAAAAREAAAASSAGSGEELKHSSGEEDERLKSCGKCGHELEQAFFTSPQWRRPQGVCRYCTHYWWGFEGSQ